MLAKAIAQLVAGGAGGKILQLQSDLSGSLLTGATQIPWDNTKPRQSGPAEGNEYFSLNIIPANASNGILLLGNVFVANSNGAGYVTGAFFEDAVAEAIYSTSQYLMNIGWSGVTLTLFHWIPAVGTTSPITYKLRIGSQAIGTTNINGTVGVQKHNGVMISGFIALEVEA